MEIKLRGKIWKQIIFEEYINLNRREHLAVFIDEFYNEKTYFMEVYNVPCTTDEMEDNK